MTLNPHHGLQHHGLCAHPGHFYLGHHDLYVPGNQLAPLVWARLPLPQPSQVPAPQVPLPRLGRCHTRCKPAPYPEEQHPRPRSAVHPRGVLFHSPDCPGVHGDHASDDCHQLPVNPRPPRPHCREWRYFLQWALPRWAQPPWAQLRAALRYESRSLAPLLAGCHYDSCFAHHGGHDPAPHVQPVHPQLPVAQGQAPKRPM